MQKKLINLAEMLIILKKSGYTEEDIASAVNVNQSTISRLLSGKIRQARFDIALKIHSIYQKHHKTND